MTGLDGEVALITGASSGIGAAIARRFAAATAKLVIAARRLDRLEALADELRAGGADVSALAADVTQEQDVERLFAETGRMHGRLDVLVNNAGVADATPTDELTLARWREVMDVNLTSAFLCSRAALQVMKAAGSGRIVNIGSISARVPRPHSAAYTASKFALDGLTRALALDGRDHGVTASVVHPGSTLSELGGGDPRRAPTERTMRAETVAEVVYCMAAMPKDANVLEALILPIGQPFLGRG